MFKPILSIIIVNYNTPALTIDCLRSILTDKGLTFSDKDQSDRSPAEIILIDNASSDNSIDQIKAFIKSKKINNLKFIANQTNLGFGKANNQGLQVSQGNYVLLLNSDTIILHSAISQSLDWLSGHPEAWGCTAQLLNRDKTIQPSGGFFPNLANTLTWSLRFDDLPLVNRLVPAFHPHAPEFYTHDQFFLHDHPQEWITGAFMLIRKNVMTAVGGFDDSYFMYGEEMEMCARIHQQFPKLQCWYLVGPQIIHLGGGSAKSKQQVLSRERQGILKFFQIHHPTWQTPLVQSFLAVNRLLSHV